jgi:ADP-ribose pyrophosphatase YjhB (NUDIX family)
VDPVKKDTVDCVVVLITDGMGHLLMGRRNDNKLWTLVAGHIAEDETPEQAAYREVKEESGLKAQFLSFIKTGQGQTGKIYFYSTQIQGEPTNENDPDKETSKVVWVDVREGVPKNIYDHLHPKGDANLIRQIFDMKKSEKIWVEEGGFAVLEKTEETEVSKLLKHPNPQERSLGLKLSSVSPEDIAHAILDPDQKVFQTAFNHRDAAHALTVLSSNTRDAAGNPLWDRHDVLLNSPKLTKDHITLMAGAVKHDTALPVQEQAKRLRVLAQHGYTDIQKNESIWAHHLLYAGSSQHPTGKVSRAENEDTHEHLKPLKNAYETALTANKAIEPNNAGLHDVGQVSPKVVYNVGEHKLMVKPYEEEEHPTAGWAESTSQHLYHTAGLGHLHQQSFVSNHGGGKYSIPATVIKIDTKSIPIHKAGLGEVRKQNPDLENEARKIALMDFVTANVDRHSGNLMVQPNGHLLAIDNAIAFGKPGKSLDEISSKPGVASVAPGTKTPEGRSAYQKLVKEWWPTVSNDLKRHVDKRLDLIQHPVFKRRMGEAFNSRAAWLDNKAAQEGDIASFGDYAHQELQKRMEGAEFLSNYPDSKVEGLHESLLDKHPAVHNADVQEFEKNVNKNDSPIQPLKHALEGIDTKALYKHGDKSYMIKPSVFKWGNSTLNTPLSAWAELGSQNAYHAGGIGHLHQKSHATIAHGHFPDSHGLVIHMAPGVKELASATPEEKEKLKTHPDLKKIGFMDFVTFNNDRHDSNLMIDSKGSPLGIDHSLSYGHDRDEASHENQDLWWQQPGDGLGKGFKEAVKPDAATWNWWNNNKQKIIDAHHKHLDLIPDKDVRNRMRDSFDYRINAIDEGWTPLGKPITEGEERLQKTLEGADFLHTQHDIPSVVKKPDMTGVHEKLKMATPAAVKPHRERFELGLNQHKDVVKPIMSMGMDSSKTRDMGEEAKAIYQSGNHKFMIKPQVGPTTSMSAWNELTSQSLYHAGGIGHLHQKVHATTLANHPQTDPAKQPHAVAIHMEPDAMPVHKASEKEDPRFGKMFDNPQHVQSLKKIGLMDWLTSNADRHSGNILLKPDGSPIAIDHGRSWLSDRAHAIGREISHEDPEVNKWTDEMNRNPHAQKQEFDAFNGFNGKVVDGHLMHYSDAMTYGGAPDTETWNWWNQNKDKMRDAFHKHVNMLPDENVRNRMKQSFDVRFNHINGLRAGHSEEPEGFGNEKTVANIAHKPTEIDPVLAHRTIKEKQRMAG